MAKGKKRTTVALYAHDHGDTTQNSVIQISGDYRRRRVRSRPVPIDTFTFSHSDAPDVPQDEDLPPFDPFEFHDSLPVAITDQVEGITVMAKEKAKRYENSVSAKASTRSARTSNSF